MGQGVKRRGLFFWPVVAAGWAGLAVALGPVVVTVQAASPGGMPAALAAGARPVQAPAAGAPDAADAAEAEAVRARLARPEPMTPEEIAAALAAIARTMRGRTVRATDGHEVITVDQQGQNVLFAVLTGTLPVQDVGLQDGGGGQVRGFRAPATPARSEVGAKQTLWIDVRRLLPTRFELLYEVPGIGDAAFDFRIE